ncbi:MAG: 2TM domain-containing protein [Aurantibacter sp.]
MNTDLDKYIRAKKRVDEQRGFYIHLMVFIVFNLSLLIFRTGITDLVLRVADLSADFSEIIELNILLTPIFWGFAIFVHFLVVFGFRPKFLKKWEEQKIQKYIKNDK